MENLGEEANEELLQLEQGNEDVESEQNVGNNEWMRQSAGVCSSSDEDESTDCESDSDESSELESDRRNVVQFDTCFADHPSIQVRITI